VAVAYSPWISSAAGMVCELAEQRAVEVIAGAQAVHTAKLDR
jgi:hypothetical protein